MRKALTVSPADRLVSTLFLAAAIHAVVILGITFDIPKPDKASKSLEIALVQRSSEKAPDKADFLAQANMLGSGEAEKKLKVTERGMPQATPSAGKSMERPQKASSEASARKMIVQQKSERSIVSSEKEKKEIKPSKLTTESLARQISQLSKELSMADQSFAKRPRIKFINSMSAKQYVFAQYESEWQKKIERIGNLNYPDEARRKKLSGRLLLTVWINSDGSMEKVELSRSSGHKVLDDAALRIVKLAAPFAKFPPKIAKEADQLAITRTWRFASDKVSTR